jgi:hypothetical protein
MAAIRSGGDSRVAYATHDALFENFWAEESAVWKETLPSLDHPPDKDQTVLIARRRNEVLEKQFELDFASL